MNSRAWVEGYAGWCPRADMSPGNIPLNTGSAPEYMHEGRDAFPPRIIAPALILLLPLLPALIVICYSLMIPVFLPSTGVQMAIKALIVGLPAALLILYGRRTHDVIGSVLSGVFLYPLFGIYAHSLGLLFIPGFLGTLPVVHRLTWNLLAAAVLFGALFAAVGFFASKRTIGSLLSAVALGALMTAIVWGIR